MLPKLRPLLVGAATFIPGARQLLTAAKESMGLGGATSARYCYSVWLRHVVLLHSNGLWRQPQAVAELGPGDSLGIGIAALLSGSERYHAFDVMRFANSANNETVFEELVELFQRREPIPDDREFPEVTPRLSSYKFPSDIFTDALLQKSLAADRIRYLRAAANAPSANEIMSYFPDWHKTKPRLDQQVDLIYSQAVLEHVSNLQETYQILHQWLKADGVMSHAIDFRCHNMFAEWNGHWTVSNFIWKIVEGKRVYLLNREPCSQHLALLNSNKFTTAVIDRYPLPSTLKRTDLSAKFKTMTDEDMTTGMATIQSSTKKSF